MVEWTDLEERPYRSQMPKGPKGEKRPADVVGAAVMIAKIATGELDDAVPRNSEKPRENQKDEPKNPSSPNRKQH
jgi:hypothetical protein